MELYSKVISGFREEQYQTVSKWTWVLILGLSLISRGFEWVLDLICQLYKTRVVDSMLSNPILFLKYYVSGRAYFKIVIIYLENILGIIDFLGSSSYYDKIH